MAAAATMQAIAVPETRSEEAPGKASSSRAARRVSLPCVAGMSGSDSTFVTRPSVVRALGAEQTDHLRRGGIHWPDGSRKIRCRVAVRRVLSKPCARWEQATSGPDPAEVTRSPCGPSAGRKNARSPRAGDQHSRRRLLARPQGLRRSAVASGERGLRVHVRSSVSGGHCVADGSGSIPR